MVIEDLQIKQMRNRNVIKDEIFQLIREYSRIEVQEKQAYVTGETIPYCSRVYDEQERINLVDSALDFWLTAGNYAEQFESDFANFLGVKYAYAVNSGSSANLLAFMALTSPLLGTRAIQRGDEVITVAAAFPTSIAPILQYGALPVFVDIDVPSYNIDITQLEGAVSAKTKAVFLAHTLGIPFNLQKVKDFCSKYHLWLIEDNCDALGAEAFVDGVFHKTGTVGDIGTSSFYPAHHITMGEGGAVYTSNDVLAKILLSMRDWGRDCTCPPGKDNTCGRRFNNQFGKLPKGYDHKFVYSHFGFNFKITDMQGAVGCAQLKKLEGFIKRRRENWRILKDGLTDWQEHLLLPEEDPQSRISPFGFLCMLHKRDYEERNELVKFLEKRGIQTRNLFSGNLLLHPCFEHLKEGVDYRISGSLDHTNHAMKGAFWVGVYPGMEKVQLQWIIQCIKEGM